MYLRHSAHSSVDTAPAFDTFRAPFLRKFSGETCLVNLVTCLEPKFYG